MELRGEAAVDEGEDVLVEEGANRNDVLEKLGGLAFEGFDVAEVHVSLNTAVACEESLKERVHEHLVAFHYILENDALQLQVVDVAAHVVDDGD